MKDLRESFDQIVKDRRSVRIYDEQAAFDEDAVKRSLQRAVLSPNSSNLQLWEFYRVKSKDKKEELASLCFGQKAASTANELIVIVARKDKWKERSKFILANALEGIDEKAAKKRKLVEDYYNRIIPFLYTDVPFGLLGNGKKLFASGVGAFRPMAREVSKSDVKVIVHKRAALAAQTFMLSMKAEGYDSCPMEGFDSARVKKFLSLPPAAEITMIVSVGTALPEGIYGPRVRVPEDQVIFEI